MPSPLAGAATATATGFPAMAPIKAAIRQMTIQELNFRIISQLAAAASQRLKDRQFDYTHTHTRTESTHTHTQ